MLRWVREVREFIETALAKWPRRNESDGNDHAELPPQTSQPAQPLPTEPFIWDYSRQYRDNMGEGHQKPPPATGSPTFVMHLGIWQKLQSDVVYPVSSRDTLNNKFYRFNSHNQQFSDEINRFISALQKKGRVLREGREEERFDFIETGRTMSSVLRERLSGKASFKFQNYDPRSVSFTIWWLDSEPNEANGEWGKWVENYRMKDPDFTALRVRVQVQAELDHVTMSFFIDAAKPYGEPQIYAAADVKDKPLGNRRSRISSYLKAIRDVSDAQIKAGHVERDRLPEKDIDDKTAKTLLEAADYFYSGIWDDFFASFGVKDLPLLKAGQQSTTECQIQGERFADFRGVIMAMNGLDTENNRQRAEDTTKLRALLDLSTPEPDKANERNANIGFGKLNIFDFEINEPNTILKSLWPFLRRMTPWADFRDFIGCGLIGNRLLYATPLGASGSFYADEEGPSRDTDIPAALHLPKEETEGRQTGIRPIRYLVLTKGEPHREQTGRFLERINAVGTNRLFALKNVGTVKNASIHLRLLGRELDGVLEEWGNERKKIEDWFNWELHKLRHPNAASLEPSPEEAILWYLEQNNKFHPPGGEPPTAEELETLKTRLRSHYKRLYDTRGSDFEYDTGEPNFEEFWEANPRRMWISDVTIYYILRQFAEQNDPSPASTSGNSAEMSADNGQADDTLGLLSENLAQADEATQPAPWVEWLYDRFTDKRKQKIPQKKLQQLGDQRTEKTSTLVKEIEQHLVEIGAALDNIGNGGAGRILYVINRSKYYISEFERLMHSLQISNIDGWINYEQFVQRGLMPTFNLVHITGERLVSLRARLQSVTEMIQTSALIVEAEATRTNTATLRKIASNLYLVAFPASVIAGWLLGDVGQGLLQMTAISAPVLAWAAKPVIMAAFIAWTYWLKRRRARKRAQDD